MLIYLNVYVCEFYSKYYGTFGLRNGRFRGKGQIKTLYHAIELNGKRVYPLVVRLCLGLSIIALPEIVAAIFDGELEIEQDLLMASSLIAGYATEDMILNSGHLKIGWNSINK